MNQCNYYAESKIEQWTPECCVEEGFAFNSVHPYDVDIYCAFCGGMIKLNPYTKHPKIEVSDE